MLRINLEDYQELIKVERELYKCSEDEFRHDWFLCLIGRLESVIYNIKEVSPPLQIIENDIKNLPRLTGSSSIDPHFLIDTNNK
jgi:hypothetical protein